MCGFISLPRNRIHKKEETKKFNLPSNFVESFHKEFLDDVDFSKTMIFNSSLLITLWAEIKKFLLTTSNFGEKIQGEADLYIVNNRLNEVSFKRRFNPISKNIIRNKNPIALLFKNTLPTYGLNQD